MKPVSSSTRNSCWNVSPPSPLAAALLARRLEGWPRVHALQPSFGTHRLRDAPRDQVWRCCRYDSNSGSAGVERVSLNRKHSVMRGLVPRIHVFATGQDVDGRDKHGHDAEGASIRAEHALGCRLI